MYVDFNNNRSWTGEIMTRMETTGEGIGAVLAFDPIAMCCRDLLDGADALYGFLIGHSIGSALPSNSAASIKECWKGRSVIRTSPTKLTIRKDLTY